MHTKFRIIVITGVSASGKTKLMERLASVLPNVHFIQSVTTRLPRKSDTDADYEFMTVEEFEADWERKEYITRVELNGQHYAVRLQKIREAVADADNLYVRSLTPEVLEKWDAAAPGKICFLHLETPTKEELIRRLTGSDRNMGMEEIEGRFLKEKDWDLQIERLRGKGFQIHIVRSNTIEDTLQHALEIIAL